MNDQCAHSDIEGAPHCVSKDDLEVVLVDSGVICEIIDTVDDKSVDEAQDAWVEGCRLDDPALIDGNEEGYQHPHDDATPHSENKFFLDVIEKGLVDGRHGNREPQHVKDDKRDEPDKPYQYKFFNFHVVSFLMDKIIIFFTKQFIFVL
jgi:hypothetical protein